MDKEKRKKDIIEPRVCLIRKKNISFWVIHSYKKIDREKLENKDNKYLQILIMWPQLSIRCKPRLMKQERAKYKLHQH